eukprot:g232.t1
MLSRNDAAILVFPAALSLLGSLFIALSMYMLKHKLIEPRKKQILYLSIADIGFSVFCIANVVLSRIMDDFGAGPRWKHALCTAHGFFMEYFASLTWLWSNCIALSSLFMVYRMKALVRKMDRWQHVVWFVAFLFVVPALIWRSPVPDNDGMKICEPNDVSYIIFTVELAVCFLFNYVVYVRILWHMRAYAPESVRERFSHRSQIYLAVFLGCWSTPFIVGVWTSMSSDTGVPTLLVRVALISQSLQGVGNAFAYGFQEKISYGAVWGECMRGGVRKDGDAAADEDDESGRDECSGGVRRGAIDDDGGSVVNSRATPLLRDEKNNISNDDGEVEATAANREDREHQRRRDDGNASDEPQMEYHVSFKDPHLKDKDSRAWINRQRIRIASRLGGKRSVFIPIPSCSSLE